MKRILFVSQYSKIMASARYRVYQYLPLLSREGYKTKVICFVRDDRKRRKLVKKTLSFLFFLKIVLTAPFFDIIFIHRYFTKLKLVNHFIRRFSSCLIFDMDDALYSQGDKMIGRKSLQAFNYLISSADHVIVVNEHLKKYVEKFNKNVSVIPTVVDVNRYERWRIRRSQHKTKDEGRVVIGWIGSSPAGINFDFLGKILDVLNQKYPDKLELKVVCNRPFPIKTKMTVRIIPWELSREMDYFEDMDIGIMPLRDDERTRGKGGFKLIQYMALGIPAVASPVGLNREIVIDGINGFLAKTEKEWIEKLSLLIEDESLRRELGARGVKTVEENFSLEQGFRKLKEILEKVCV